jgi:carbon monoxide dehydrogenase subunit G
MLIKSGFDVAQPVDKVWQFFDDIPGVAACLPGAELTQDLGDNKYAGRVAVRMGPVRLQFGGTAKIQERDDAAKRECLSWRMYRHLFGYWVLCRTFCDCGDGDSR